MASCVDCPVGDKRHHKSDLLKKGWSVIVGQTSQKWIVRDFKI